MGRTVEIKINAEEMLRKVKTKDEKTSATFYFKKNDIEDFRKACGDVSLSKVLTQLMNSFVESSQRSK